MKKIALGCAGLVIAVIVALAAYASWATNTVVDDWCSVEYRTCVGMASGFAQRLDCRIEVHHCRQEGHFEFPDGSVKERPRDGTP